MAEHLDTLAEAGWHVVALDLYGDLPRGTQGRRDLRRFVRSASGNPDDPRWTWGLTPQRLSYTYNASGTPDRYYLLDTTGRQRYRKSVPVSTMPDLLGRARTVR